MRYFLALITFFASTTLFASGSAFQRPAIPPVPSFVQGTEKAIVSLNGSWKFSMDAPKDFWKNSVNPSNWGDIQVPGECLMQGFNIKQNVEYPFKTKIEIPANFKNKKIFLRFDGVYSYARVWINGKFVREHHGGFTTWDCNITEFVKAGEPAWLTVGVTDRSDEISWGSAYAKHNIGGILRDVKLIALPKTFIERLDIKTFFDRDFKNSTLLIDASVFSANTQNGEIHFNLKSPDGHDVILQNSVLDSNGIIKNLISSPKKWDAEHPNLYILTAELFVNKTLVQTVERSFGFRTVERKGDELLVNGQPVKLRGVNRHDVHPLTGRSITPELDELDVKLLKEANVNFVRTSHYPPRKSFLNACDKYGIYVEEESAVCFVKSHGNLNTSSDEDYANRYLGQFSEMIERDINHPCVIMWSLGNESVWGDNFESTYQYAKSIDNTRPIIFSYPRTVPAGRDRVDIFSFHYENYTKNLSQQSLDLPVIHDEVAHVACYDTDEINRDPNVRNFWGESIKIFGDNLNTTTGALGLAIWGGFDELYQVPLEEFEKPEYMGKFSNYGYGEWGIIDGWRRKKPEFWLAKKAYSPIKISDIPLSIPDKNAHVEIPIYNYYDFTNLNELQILWFYGENSGEIFSVNVAPHAQGVLMIPKMDWRDDSILRLDFVKNDLLVDRYELPVFVREKHPNAWLQKYAYYGGKYKFSDPEGQALNVEENEDEIIIENSLIKIVFSKSDGLIKSGSFNSELLMVGGPYLNIVGGKKLGEWKLDTISTEQIKNEIAVHISGIQDDIPVKFQLKINGNGLITTNYKIDADMTVLAGDMFDWALKNGLAEVGIYYVLSEKIDKTSWFRNSLWTSYPENHIGRRKGTAKKHRGYGEEVYGEKPAWTWELDEKNFFLNGREHAGYNCTQDFRAMREYIWYSSAILRNSKSRVRAESNAQLATRLEITENGNIKFIVNTQWNYPKLGWGNYMKPPVYVYPGYSGTVKMRLTDNDDL